VAAVKRLCAGRQGRRGTWWWGSRMSPACTSCCCRHVLLLQAARKLLWPVTSAAMASSILKMDTGTEKAFGYVYFWVVASD
jgi:hypothetical protein